jgi:hypothetical protein
MGEYSSNGGTGNGDTFELSGFMVCILGTRQYNPAFFGNRSAGVERDSRRAKAHKTHRSLPD